ncbi:MAG: hypothetical protein JWM60_1466 [Solirubrobacterales bacterium]|nr:hypothetical protein [Solirubrobacterales bacterium]
MSPSPLLAPGRFLLERVLAEQCLGALRDRGRRGAEMFIALTAAVEDPGVVRFRRALVPRQTCHATPKGLLVTIEGDALFELNRDCYEHGELLAGQIHAHPDRAYHSGADDALALLRLPGALSIVVPNFAAGPLAPARWSVHRLGADGTWCPIPPTTRLELT